MVRLGGFALLLALGLEALPAGAASAAAPGPAGVRAATSSRAAVRPAVRLSTKSSTKTTAGVSKSASGRTAAPGKAPLSGSKAVAPKGKGGAAKKTRWPTVVLYHINRRETFPLRIADEKGRPVKGLQKRVDRFFRCHHTNAQGKMHPRLVRLLYETGRQFPGQRIEVISGYRHPKVARNPKSPHKQGLACDVRVAGVKNSDLRDFFRRSFKQVGVGYYPNSSFVHLDVRAGASAFWIDYSGPGETAMYADDPRRDLATGRADTFKRATIDPSWADEPEPEPLPAGADDDVPQPADDEGHEAAHEAAAPGAQEAAEDLAGERAAAGPSAEPQPRRVATGISGAALAPTP
jgi:uncharacterized protein YcbK (DUF882 family)